MKKSEAEFVNDGMTPEEIASLGGDTGGEQGQVVADSGEQVQEQTPVQTQPPEEPKLVDIRALQEARAAERAAREEFAKFRTEKAAEQARLEERIALINEAMAAQNKPEPVVPPSKDDDPLGFFDHKLDSVEGKYQTLEQKLAAMEKAESDRIAAANASAKRAALISEADSVISAAISQTPDLQDALSFAFEGLRADIAGHMDRSNVPLAQRQQYGEQLWQNAMTELAAKCPRDPALAADFVMRNARFYGYGYQPQQQAAQQASTQQAIQVQQPTIQQRAEQQERHMSLSGVQGGAAPQKLDAKALAAMTDEQFKELMRTAAGRKQAEEIMGGV